MIWHYIDVGVGGGKYPPISYYVDGGDSGSHQANVNLKITLNGQYTNMNITVNSGGWGTVSINGANYGAGTYDISLNGLTSIIIKNRIYANSALHAPFTINAIE